MAALPARADVRVVDNAAGPGFDHLDIQSAIAAAVDGDTILVRSGSYYLFQIDGKSLAVVADGDGVTVRGSDIFSSHEAIGVRNLGPGQEVVIRGFVSNSGAGVRDCAGAVWFDEVVVTGDVPCSSGGTAGAFVSNSAKVTFTRCSLRGESNSDPYHSVHPSAHGLDAVSSTVQLFDTELRGGWGQNLAATPYAGGAGLQLEASTVTIIGCTIQGGEGGLDTSSLCTGSHAPGGPGVRFVGGTATVRSAASTAVGGLADLDRVCPGHTGPAGPPIAGSGTIVALTGLAHHLRVNSPVRGGEILTFELGGVAGEVPLVFVAPTHEPYFLPAQNGVLLPGLPPADVFVLGPLPASGETTLSFAVPNIGGLAEGLTFYAQAIFLDAAPAIWLGGGTTVLLLEASL